MHNLHYGNIPFALSVYCQQPEHRYCTRYATSHNYVLPRVVTNRGQGSIKFAGPKAWAEVPKHLKEVAFRKPFSKKLKEHVLSQIFVELPQRVLRIRDQLQYDELKMIFDAEDDPNEFFGFDQPEDTNLEITFFNDSFGLHDEFYGFTHSENNIDLIDIFQSHSEESDEEFLGFTTAESENTSDLEILFLDGPTQLVILHILTEN